jgi:hypothetical protein
MRAQSCTSSSAKVHSRRRGEQAGTNKKKESNMKLLATSAIIMANAAVAQAQTVTIFQTGFEPTEGYAPGNLNGQNGWFTYIGEDPNFGEVVTAGALAGTQSVLCDGQDVLLGPFGNYAATGRLVSIAPEVAGVPLRYIEVTARAAILDPTIVSTHISNVWIAQYHGDDITLGGVAPGSHFGQHVFGWPVGGGGPNPHVVVFPGVAFNVRHVLDYQTGLASAWKDGTAVFLNFDQEGLVLNVPTNQFYFEGVAGGSLPFDTRVWYDDVHMKAIYGCHADTNLDLVINADDLVNVILQWGSCPKAPNPCPGNVNGDTEVNADDLVAVILGWGSCD